MFRWCCSVSSTCARNISFFSLYFKYLHACQCPTILSITTGRAGWAWMVLYEAGRPSLTSIFYTLYFASIAVFNIPASHTFSVFDVFHFTVFFLFAVVFHVYTYVQNIFLLLFFLQYGIQEPLPCSSTSLLPYSLLSLPFSKFDGARWYAEWNSTPITAMICSLALYEVLVYCANEDLVLNWKKMHDRVQF